tara:strand:+ start:11160 stop:11390 length:231 start_codon:yes stop_codon:yes gene_type:complete
MTELEQVKCMLGNCGITYTFEPIVYPCPYHELRIEIGDKPILGDDIGTCGPIFGNNERMSIFRFNKDGSLHMVGIL